MAYKKYPWSPLPGPKAVDPMTRFMRLVDHDAGLLCWYWAGAKDKDGYASFNNMQDRNRHAHRWIYEAIKGEIPVGLVVDHLCNRRECVNPDHMELVTQAENNRRTMERGADEDQCRAAYEAHP